MSTAVIHAHVVHTFGEVGGAITSAVDDNGPVILLLEPEVRVAADVDVLAVDDNGPVLLLLEPEVRVAADVDVLAVDDEGPVLLLLEDVRMLASLKLRALQRLLFAATLPSRRGMKAAPEGRPPQSGSNSSSTNSGPASPPRLTPPRTLCRGITASVAASGVLARPSKAS